MRRKTVFLMLFLLFACLFACKEEPVNYKYWAGSINEAWGVTEDKITAEDLWSLALTKKELQVIRYCGRDGKGIFFALKKEDLVYGLIKAEIVGNGENLALFNVYEVFAVSRLRGSQWLSLYKQYEKWDIGGYSLLSLQIDKNIKEGEGLHRKIAERLAFNADRRAAIQNILAEANLLNTIDSLE